MVTSMSKINRGDVMVAVYCLCLTNNRTSLVQQLNNNKEFSELNVCDGFTGLFNSLPLF